MTYKIFINKVMGRIEHHYYQVKNFFLKNKVQLPYDPSWFTGKRVALIGGADSAYQEKKGKYIDDFDVVVRINKGIEMLENNAKFVGQRTDFLFHAFYENTKQTSSPITPKLWHQKKVKTLIRTTLNGSTQKYLHSFLNIAVKDNQRYVELPQSLIETATNLLYGNLPTTGFLALYSILNAQPKQFYITGITFFKTPYNNSYRKISLDDVRDYVKTNNLHNFDLEFDWFYSKYHEMKNQNIIKTDQKLHELLSQKS